MNIGIITIHNVSNYGAVLQAYALKETVNKKYNAYIINFDNRHVSKSLDYIRFGTNLHACLGTAKDICRIVPRMIVIPKFKSFIREKLNLIDFDSNRLDVLDVLISGSDQIWNPACVTPDRKLISEYFLSFANQEQKKISYASSCGSYSYSDEEEKKIKFYLTQYDSLSTRERNTSDYLSELINKDVKHVLDPTLLLKKDEWLERIPDNNYRTDDYILLYVIKKTPLLKFAINKIKKELGIKVILINQGLYFDSVVNEHIRDAGPKDFISLFNNAKFIITDSFHGTTFSLIFNKPFFSISPGVNVNRISSLLEVLGLESRIIHDERCLDGMLDKIFDVDYKKTNHLLDEERNKSLDYLFSSLDY